MASVVTTSVVDPEALDELLCPRDDIVRERRVGEAAFEAVSGPFRDYRREVAAVPAGDGRVEVTERTSFRLAIPFWGALFVWPMKRELRRLTDRQRAQQPVWAPPDRFDARAANVLGLLCTVALVGGYLGTLISQTITFAIDEFGSSKTAEGTTLAAVRVGVVLSLVLVATADRRGRRRMLLGSTAASCVTAAFGAVAPNLVMLGVTQTLSRGLSTTAVLLVGIVAAEEMPKGSRAYAVSVMAMTSALGAGISLWALPLADLHVRGWRILYLIPLLGLPVLGLVGRHLPESRRFVAPHPDTPVVSGHGRRLWVLAASFFLISSFTAPASQLLNDFLREERGFSAGRVALFVALTSTPGAIGIVVGGRMADVRGRRLLVAVGVAVGAVLTTLSFATAGWTMWAWNLVGTIFAAAAVPALGVYGPELFPTGSRGRANGIIQLVSVSGSALGLVIAGVIADRTGSFTDAMQVLLVGPLVVVVLVLTLFPETARRELEELNPEDVPPAPA